jgi:hypothetical protein
LKYFIVVLLLKTQMVALMIAGIDSNCKHKHDAGTRAGGGRLCPDTILMA